jgi:hypothetical protein
MLALDPSRIDEGESQNGNLEEVVKYLCERSLELQEYSRSLKERSHEINRRFQSCVNSKPTLRA